MTNEEQRIHFEKCEKWHGCSASVCPLYQAIESTHYIPGDRRCTKILDYLEGNELPEGLKTAIAEMEPKWREVLGDALLNKWLNNRKDVRNHFKKSDLIRFIDGLETHKAGHAMIYPHGMGSVPQIPSK